MRKNLYLLLFLVFVLFSVLPTGTADSSFGFVTIAKEGDFIDIDAETIKFLFKVPAGTDVTFLLGESPETLKPVKSIRNYDHKNGLRIGNLQAGKKYYYQIQATNGGESKTSEVFSFVKLNFARRAKMAEWARTSVFYQVFVRSFYDGKGEDGIGDFQGLKKKLGYIKSLGADGIWLLPIFDSPSYHGYDVVDYLKIDPDYGTMKDFQEFLAEAHKLGIKVILDLPVNHTSVQHPWFEESASDKYGEKRDYYVWADLMDDRTVRGPWGQNTIWYNKNGDYYTALFWNGMPDLNLRNPKVRQEIKEIARFWLDPNGDGDTSDGVDWFRLDAALHIDHIDQEVTLKWWQEFDSYVKSINPNAYLVGEVWTAPDKIAPFLQSMDSTLNFNIAPKIFVASGGGFSYDLAAEVNAMYDEYRKYNKDFMDATFLTNHDQNRVASMFRGNINRLKMITSIFLTLPGTPFIYYGEELGQQGKKPDECLREPMDWYASAQGPGMTDMSKWTYVKSMYTKPGDGISVEEQENDENSLLNHYRRLIRIRKENPLLFVGNLKNINLPSLTAYEVSGKGYDYVLQVIHNGNAQAKTISVQPGAVELISGQKITGEQLEIAPFSSVILKITK